MMAATAEVVTGLVDREVSEPRSEGRTAKAQTLSARAEFPSWFGSTVEQISSLLDLETNWDSYGGHPVDLEAARLAIEILSQPVFSLVPEPWIVPTCQGGLQAEWEISGRSLELEFRPDLDVAVLYVDDDSGEEDEWVLNYDLRDLQSLLYRLRG